MSDEAPLFSVVIPAFERERHVRLAAASCLAQRGPSFEVVVVDDGSADGTAAAAASLGDPRLRVLRHAVNRGVCPARNTGTDATRGEWVIFLDSDEELLPGALATIAARAAETPDDVGVLCFMYRVESGGFSPEPPLPAARMSFADFLRWADGAAERSDMLYCVRRTIAREVRFPDSRAWENKHTLDLARRCDRLTFPDVVALAHVDAANRLTAMAPDRFRADAADRAREIEAALAAYDADLRAFAPRLRERQLRSAANAHFAAGARALGLRRALQALARRPLRPVLWASIAFGLLGPRMFHAARALRRSR